MTPSRTPFDQFIIGIDKALRVIGGVTAPTRATPGARVDDGNLDAQQQRHSAGLMRINHVGEYNAQARFAKSPELRAQFEQAGREEEDHLAWTAERLAELGSQPSFLNPLWYVGSYAMGAVAAQLGDARSLGFVVETERQVEAHLNSHLDQLPELDAKSRAIVEQMRVDEIAHGAAAQAMGAAEMPAPVKLAMTGMAKVMTTAAYYV